MTAKERLHLAIAELSESEVEEALRYLAWLRDRGQALLEWLGAHDASAESRRGASTPLERLRCELS